MKRAQRRVYIVQAGSVYEKKFNIKDAMKLVDKLMNEGWESVGITVNKSVYI